MYINRLMMNSLYFQLVNSILNQLAKEVDLENDAIIVKLNGLIHGDEKVALKGITAQVILFSSI